MTQPTATSTAGDSGFVGRYLDELSQAAASGWNRFWFTATDPATLGLIRVLTGAMLVYTHLVWGLQFEAFFGASSWTSADVIGEFQPNSFAWSFWWLVPPHLGLAVHYLCVGLLILFMLGFLTRLTSLTALVIVISYAHRVPTALFGLDQINGMLTLYCAEQAILSIGANVTIRLIQLHMCIIYFFAGLAKLQGESWWNGLAMWYSFANREYQTLNVTWLAEYPWIINAMTHLTVLFEIGFCALIWHRLARPLVLLLAVVLHIGIGVCLGMWTFGLIMLVGCTAFVPPHIVRAILQRRRRTIRY
jgi:Vitamin K-dependent gamma-carboxylase